MSFDIGPLFILIAMILLFLAICLSIIYIINYLLFKDGTQDRHKYFTRKKSMTVICLFLGYVIFYALGYVLIN